MDILTNNMYQRYAQFDDACLYIDKFGSSYEYDSDGKLVAATDGTGQGMSYTEYTSISIDATALIFAYCSRSALPSVGGYPYIALAPAY